MADAQDIIGQSDTFAGALVVHDTVTEPPPAAGAGMTHVTFECPPKLGSARLFWLPDDGPPVRTTRVKINPVPRAAMTMPVTTRPRRTWVGREGPPIDLWGYRGQQKRPVRGVYTRIR